MKIYEQTRPVAQSINRRGLTPRNRKIADFFARSAIPLSLRAKNVRIQARFFQVFADGVRICVRVEGLRGLHEKQAFCWEMEGLARVPVPGLGPRARLATEIVE
jgi:hypothetical protein